MVHGKGIYTRACRKKIVPIQHGHRSPGDHLAEMPGGEPRDNPVVRQAPPGNGYKRGRNGITPPMTCSC
jgi:hypothetical protein